MKYLFLALFSITLFSCNSKDYETIIGDWHCAQWITTATGVDNCNDNVYFLFNEDKTYLSRIGDLEQSGHFEIINDQLTCYPEGSMKIGVKLTKLTPDTLAFTMNRTGTKEELILIRQ